MTMQKQARCRSGSFSLNGKTAILVIFGLGLAASLFAVWFNWSKTHRTLNRLGRSQSVLIAHAPQVNFLRIKKSTAAQLSDEPGLLIQNQPFVVEQLLDISRKPGMTHLRHALLQDASYVWQPATEPDPNWQYGLQFREHNQEVLLVFDLSAQTVYVVEKSTSLTIGDRLASGLDLYFQEITKLQGRD
ncbi:MAG: hypothetical protein CMJ62_18275 [Planctomycetaceae bacterium]|nr:hypothetical protein [Planctomycetaceae bacterium]